MCVEGCGVSSSYIWSVHTVYAVANEYELAVLCCEVLQSLNFISYTFVWCGM